VSMAGSYVSFHFRNLMYQVQMIFSLFSAPLWAIFLLGMTTKRTTMRGALWGFSSGIGVALIHHFCVEQHWIHYGSVMSANFYVAILGFCTAITVAWIVSMRSREETVRDVSRFMFDRRMTWSGGNAPFLWLLALLLLTVCIVLNVLWR
ncbi:MAG: sodium:solute symporter family transporter, partial [Acidobacteriaceae bacterium]